VTSRSRRPATGSQRGSITPRRGRQRATAVRQALSLCEAELLSLTWDSPAPPHRRPDTGRGLDRISAGTTRAALRATGVPPGLAAVLRNRLRLIPDLEDATP
jgi:hypothetical protein